MGFGGIELGSVVFGLPVTSSTVRKSELLESVPQGPTTAVDSGGVLLAVLWLGLDFPNLFRLVLQKLGQILRILLLVALGTGQG
jgi:hypothetical protein